MTGTKAASAEPCSEGCGAYLSFRANGRPILASSGQNVNVNLPRRLRPHAKNPSPWRYTRYGAQ